MSGHSYFFVKLKIVEKSLRKVKCSFGKVSYTYILNDLNNFIRLFSENQGSLKADIFII